MPFCVRTCSKPSSKLDLSAPVFCLWPFCSEGANYWEVWQWFCWGVHLCTDNWTWVSKANLCKLSKPERRARTPPAPHALPLLCNAAAGRDHAWTELAAKLTVLSSFMMLSGCNWIQCVAGRRINLELLFLPGLFHEPPQPALHCTLPPWELASFRKYGILHLNSSKKANMNILWLSWYLGNANLIPKSW